MKKAYVKPAMDVEEFIPNIYCANCVFTETMVSANVYCAIPGTSDSALMDGGTGVNAGWREHLAHGNGFCSGDHAANTTGTNGDEGYHSVNCDGTINIGQSTGIEPGTGSTIYGLQFGTINTTGSYSCFGDNPSGLSSDWNKLHVNTYYNATWKSKDNSNREYIHYGGLYINGTENPKNMS